MNDASKTTWSETKVELSTGTVEYWEFPHTKSIHIVIIDKFCVTFVGELWL